MSYSIDEKAACPLSLIYSKILKDMNTEHTARPKLFIGIDIHKRSWKVHCSTDSFQARPIQMSP